MANSIYEATGDGSTTDFTIPYTYLEADDVTAFVGGVSTSFTFTSNNVITFSTAPASGASVRILRNTDVDNLNVTYSDGGALTASDLNTSNTQLLFGIQEAIDIAKEAMAIDQSDGKFNAQHASANRVIKNVGTPTDANDATTKSYVDTSANNAASSAAAALVSQNASAASATASANSATASAGSASTSANEATDSANSATASAASASTASTQATLANTNGAAQVALATTQANNAASSASTAATQATLATTNGAAQVALATTQANNAASSATTATTQATASASSAATSATQATNSANSATASANSASSASSAQTAAESARDATLAAYDNFDDRYLGTMSSAPIVDNDGDALVAGALYFDSVAGAMYVYTGSAWVAAYVSGTGFLALAGGTMSGDINFGDADYAYFGASNDLKIGHTGSASVIQETGTGDLYLDATNFQIRSGDGSETLATLTTDGAVNLYHDNALKLATTSLGADITGVLTADGLTVDGTTDGSGVTAGLVSGQNVEVGLDRWTGSGSNFHQWQFYTDVSDLQIRNVYNNTKGTAFTPRVDFANNGDISFYASNGLTQGFYWDASAQRLGLGTTSPSQEIHGYSSGGDFSLKLESASATGTAYTYYKNADREYATGIRGSAGDSFQIIDITDDVTRLAIDSSGNVGIGTASPAVASGTGLQIHNAASGAQTRLSLTNNSTGSASSDGLQLVVENGGGALIEQREAQHLGFATSASERGRFDNGTNFFVGKTSDTSTGTGLTLSGSGFVRAVRNEVCGVFNRQGSDGTVVLFQRSDSGVGSISVTTSGTTYNTTSDIRLKTDIEPLAATDKLMAMNPVSYNWKVDPDGPRSMGFIAQEMRSVMPEAVSTGEDDDAMMSMDYGRITPVLVAALQDAHKKIEQLEQRIADMEAK